MLATRGEAEIHAGCCGKTERALGGHIHFGAHLDSRTIKALDYFLALPYRTMVANSDFQVRHQTGYGRLSEIRSQAWGSEYRTLSSWIVYPKVAESVLCVAYVVADHYLHHRTPEVTYTDFDYQNGSLEALRTVARDAGLKIESFRLYSKYKKQIQRFYRMVLNDHFQIDEGSNVWTNWLEEKTVSKVQTQYQRIRQQRATARFTFTGDDHLAEVSEAVTHLRWEGTNIQVYGVRRDRPVSVRYYNIPGFASASFREMTAILEGESWDVSQLPSSFSPSIGFRMNLRETEEGRAKIIQILKNIAARMPNPVMEA
jgi:CRISPR/Cas system CSM-associated protein Csm2 small subunit